MYISMIAFFAIAFILLCVGLIEPSNVIWWGEYEKKTRRNVLKYYGTSLIVLLLILVFSRDAIAQYERDTIQEQKIAAAQKKEVETKKKENEENKKYVVILDSGKTYEAMTTQERTDISELLQTWDKKSQDFKDKYKTQKEFVEKTQKEAVAKWKAEEEAKKAAAEAKKAEDEKVGYDTGITYDQLARTPDDYKSKKAKFTGKVIQVMESGSETNLRIAVNNNYDTVLLVTYSSSISKQRVLENDNVTVKGVSQGLYTYKSTMGGNITIPFLKVNEIQINNK